MPTGSERDRQRKPPRFRLNRALHVCVDWLVPARGHNPAIFGQLLHQSLTKKRTLIVSVVATSLMASIAAVLTAAPWAYAWLLAELLIGGIRISLMSAFAKAEPSRRNRNVIAPILAGLAAFVVILVINASNPVNGC
jgi:hypothetical protein